jgi:glycosyltransferase involved in cell wall biosynthesis
LEKALESVVGQLRPGDEVVISDNASTDGTQDYIKERFGNHPGIAYKRNAENIGPVMNFGKVIEAASNAHIFFLTDDDILLAGALNAARKFFEEYQVTAFKTGFYTYFEKGKEGELKILTRKDVTPKNISLKMAGKILHASHVLTGFCFKKELFSWDDLLAFEKNWYPSMMFMGKAGTNIGYLAEPTNVHTWENETFWGISPDKRDELNLGQVKTIRYLFEKKYISYDHYFELVYKHYRSWPYENNKLLFEILTPAHKFKVGLLKTWRIVIKINHYLKRAFTKG